MISMKALAQRLRMCQRADSAWDLVRRELQVGMHYPYSLEGTLRLDLPEEWGRASFLYNSRTKLFGFDRNGRIVWGTENAAHEFGLHIAFVEARAQEGA